ncbi:MAG: AMP-binding protein, partial [Marmoricola sp.]
MDLSPGDRVALLVPGSVAYVELVIALLRRGVFPIPMDAALTAIERDRLLADLAPRHVVTEPVEVETLLAEIGPGDGNPRGRPIHVTSGTTGRPKGVWSGLLDDAAAEALVREERELWGFTRTDVNLVLSPLHHSAPLRFAMGTVLAGGRVVAPGPFDPVAVTRVIEHDRPTTMFCVPAHLQRLFAHWEE